MNNPLLENIGQQEIHFLHPERGAHPLPWAVPRDEVRGYSGSGTMLANHPVGAEPFRNRNGRVRVFVQFAPGTNPTVNGEPAPEMMVLAPGDVVHWLGDEGGFKIALFNRPDIGPPTESLIGKQCPVCRVPFGKESVCLRCPCGAAMHCEPDGSNSLQCAQLRQSCPVCNRSTSTKEGYVEESAE